MKVKEDCHDAHNLLLLLIAERGASYFRSRVEDEGLEEGFAQGL